MVPSPKTNLSSELFESQHSWSTLLQSSFDLDWNLLVRRLGIDEHLCTTRLSDMTHEPHEQSSSVFSQLPPSAPTMRAEGCPRYFELFLCTCKIDARHFEHRI